MSFLVKIPLVPPLPFLKLEISDVPIFISALIFGMPSAISILTVVTVLRTLLLSSAGWPGFIFRMTSVVIIFFLCLSKRFSNIFYKILCIFLGTLVYVIIKIPINYILWINMFGMSKTLLDNLLFTVIIPFNIIKCLLNYILAFALVEPTRKILHTTKKIFP
jgi:riboflavin transporter FmnP